MATTIDDSALAPALHIDLPPTPPLSTTSDHLDSHKDNASTSKPSNTTPMVEPAKIAPRRIRSLKGSLALPKEWLNMYSSFVQKNASSVAQIESALRSLTYIIPGRFRDAEIASESLHSSIQLLSLYHDTLLTRALAKLPGMPSIQTSHNRYTNFWTQKSGTYRKIAVMLQCVQYTELLWEMAAKRRGERVRWRVVVLIEVLKALCRLLLLRITGGRMVVPPLPERVQVPEESAAEEDEDLWYGDEGQEERPKKTPKDWTMPRTGLKLPTLPNPSNISSFLLSKVLTADDIKPATKLLSKIQGSAQLAEILHIIRPVIYAVAMARSREKKSWQPWLLGISIELAARQLRRDGPGMRETALEKEEWNRRGWAMGWWGLRGAFYENVTKSMVESFVESRWVPGLVGGILTDYTFLWENYHFASADM